MRRFFIILGIFTLSQTLISQTSIKFIEGNLNVAFEKANIENKPVCLLCYASWCPHCANMREKVFNTTAVADFFNKNFICVEQDMEKGDGIEMHTRFIITSYPTILYMDKNQNILYRTTGEFNPQNFIQEGKNSFILQKQLPYLKEKYEQDKSNPSNCYNYIRALNKGGVSCSDEAKQYFKTQTDNQIISEINWRIFSNCINDLKTKEYKYVLDHLKEFKSITSPERVQQKLIYTTKSVLTPLVESNDTINYSINKTILAKIGNYQIDSLIFNDDITIDDYNNRWANYEDKTLLLTEKYNWNNYELLNEIGNNYLSNITDPITLKIAIGWVKRSLKLHPQYDSYLLCAKLYQKINDFPNAIIMAKNAENEALSNGWNHDEADKLIKALQNK